MCGMAAPFLALSFIMLYGLLACYLRFASTWRRIPGPWEPCHRPPHSEAFETTPPIHCMRKLRGVRYEAKDPKLGAMLLALLPFARSMSWLFLQARFWGRRLASKDPKLGAMLLALLSYARSMSWPFLRCPFAPTGRRNGEDTLPQTATTRKHETDCENPFCLQVWPMMAWASRIYSLSRKPPILQNGSA